MLTEGSIFGEWSYICMLTQGPIYEMDLITYGNVY